MAVIRSRPRLSLWIEGKGRFQVSQFFSDWSRNQIPRATCVLAVGRKATDGRTAAKIHKEIQGLKKSLRVKVYFCGEGQWDQFTEWPEEEVVIFDGRLLGIGYQKVQGKLNFSAYLTHWLADLNYSSALSSQSHPSNPTELTFSAVVGSLVRTGVLLGAPYGISQTAEAEDITSSNVREDLWGKALKPMLCNLAREKHVRFKGALRDCMGDDEGKNTQALEALKRIEGVIDEDDCSLALSCYTPPLSLDFDEAVPEEVGHAIAQAIRRESIQSFGQNTLWGKLVGTYSAAFMFSVVPLVDKALVVPFMPGLRDQYCKEISADDYGQVKTSAEIKRPIRATAIYAGRELKTRVLSSSRSGAAMLGIGGCFKPEDVDTSDGMIYFMKPPAWLQGIPTAGYSALRTLGLKSRNGTSSSTTPLAEARGSIRGTKDGKPREDVIRDVTELYNGYAQGLYVLESLRGRTGILPGKLRFDIAPGSNIKIEGTTEKFLPDSDLLGQSIIASVVRVSIGIDAEAPRAGTAFQVDHIRTEKENEQDATSVNLHPLYRTKFLGAPLVDELQFPNGDCC